MNIREIVQNYYDYANHGDWDKALALLSDDIVVDDQLAGHLAGIDVLRKAADAVSGGKGEFLAYPQHTLVDGDAACVIWRYEGKNAQGVKIAYPGDADRPVIGATYFQLQDGKITYMRTMHDSVPFVHPAQP
jgi:SnoaL-like protein